MKIKIGYKTTAALMFFLSICSCHFEKETQRADKDVQVVSKDYPTQYLVDAYTAKSMLEHDKAITLIQISKKEAYDLEHLPGALRIYREDFQVDMEGYYGIIASRQTIEALLSRLGVTANTKLVLYDEFGNVNSARLWWVLKRYGLTNMVMIDGGLTAWKLAGLPVTQVVPEIPIASTYHFMTSGDTSQLATLQMVEKAIGNAGYQIIDTRSTEEFSGEIQKRGASRSGRIPGSIQIDYIDALNSSTDYTFKSIVELDSIYRSKGISKDHKIITYCHSGVRSAFTTFVLCELLGFQSVQNYDGSWVEWSYHMALPIQKDTTNPI